MLFFWCVKFERNMQHKQTATDHDYSVLASSVKHMVAEKLHHKSGTLVKYLQTWP